MLHAVPEKLVKAPSQSECDPVRRWDKSYNVSSQAFCTDKVDEAVEGCDAMLRYHHIMHLVPLAA